MWCGRQRRLRHTHTHSSSLRRTTSGDFSRMHIGRGIPLQWGCASIDRDRSIGAHAAHSVQPDDRLGRGIDRSIDRSRSVGRTIDPPPSVTGCVVGYSRRLSCVWATATSQSRKSDAHSIISSTNTNKHRSQSPLEDPSAPDTATTWGDRCPRSPQQSAASNPSPPDTMKEAFARLRRNRRIVEASFVSRELGLN